ncbi:MAG: hypothetical protein AAFQ80_20615 [Cyanobacteria bacterium J06621_8]
MLKKFFLITSFLFFNLSIKTAQACSYSPAPFPGERLWGSSLALQGQVIAIKPIENEDYHEIILKVSKVWNSNPNKKLGVYKRYVFKIHTDHIYPPERAYSAASYCITRRSYEAIEKYGYYVFSIEDAGTEFPVGLKLVQVDSAKDFRWLVSEISGYDDYDNTLGVNLHLEHWTKEGYLYNPSITGSNLTYEIFIENNE